MTTQLKAQPEISATHAFLMAKAEFLKEVTNVGKPEPAAAVSGITGKRELISNALKLAGINFMAAVKLASTYSEKQIDSLAPHARMLAILDSFEKSRKYSKLSEEGTKRVLILVDADNAAYGIGLRDAAAALEGDDRVWLLRMTPEVEAGVLLAKFKPNVVLLLADHEQYKMIWSHLVDLFAARQGGMLIKIDNERPWEFGVGAKSLNPF